MKELPLIVWLDDWRKYIARLSPEGRRLARIRLDDEAILTIERSHDPVETFEQLEFNFTPYPSQVEKLMQIGVAGIGIGAEDFVKHVRLLGKWESE